MQWRPHEGPQTQALQSKCFETLYGGSRGGGKTDAGLIWLVKPYLITNPRARALVIRKNADDLQDWVDRAIYFYARYGAVATGKPATIRFPSGYKIRTGHLKDDQAYTKYQGHEYQRILLEELTQIPQEKYYLQLLGSCRSTIPSVDARIFATTNPGGVGHAWVKKRFVDPSVWGEKFIGSDTQRSRIFIPAKVEDNPHLVENDPGYVKYLDGLAETDPELYKAWRLGDWDTFAGQYFREFSRKTHVMKAFTPNWENKNYAFVGGLDWGRTDPFCFLAALVMKVEKPSLPVFYRVIIFKECYGVGPGVGYGPKDWAEIISKQVKLGKFLWIQADTQIFATQNDTSIDIAEQFFNANPLFRGRLKPASKDRINGWENMHNWLSLAPDGLPYLLVTDNCVNFIRTIPELVHDETIVEDVDTTQEDHAGDAARYMLKALHWIDARQGAVKSKTSPLLVPKLKSPLFTIDLTKFEKASKEVNRDWRTVG